MVDYRHVIHALKRKPQALARLGLPRQACSPREEYAAAWAAPVRGAAAEGRLPAHGGASSRSPMTRAARAELAHLIAEDLAEGHAPDARAPSVPGSSRAAAVCPPTSPSR